MTRKKVKLTYITNDSARKATFKKRKKGLMKKVSELSTLCDVEACAIIYSPYDAQPEVWPSRLGVQRVLAHFKTMPEMEQCKKMVNQETFLRQRIAKANEQLKKLRKDNREKEMARVMFGSLTGKPIQGLSMVDLNDLGWIIDHHLKEIYNRIKILNEGGGEGRKMEDQEEQVEQKAVVMGDLHHNGWGFEMNGQRQQHQQPQQPPWFSDMMMMNPQNQPAGIGFGGSGEDPMMMPFANQGQINSIWSNNAFLP